MDGGNRIMEARVSTLIMAGGVGSRLAPLSTPEKPKQFLDVLDCGATLLEMTHLRLKYAFPDAEHWAICPRRYFDFFEEQNVKCKMILESPEGKNTAIAIALAVGIIGVSPRDEDVLVIVPADAYVEQLDMFKEDMNKAVRMALAFPEIVCLGITPTFPSTDYGYINYNGNRIEQFTEKPSKELAETYLKAGTYFWNSGIFVVRTKVLLDKYKQYASELWKGRFSSDGPKISFDYAIMEKAGGMVVPVKWNWSDLGSFNAINKVKCYLKTNQRESSSQE